MKTDIELGMQIPQSVNNAPAKVTVYPTDGEDEIVQKCTNTISLEVERVLFGFFENLERSVRTYSVETGFKENMKSALKSLKTALFKGKVKIDEKEEGYDVEGILDGPNIEQAKKLLGTLKIIKTIDDVRRSISFDIQNLTVTIGRSQKIIDEQTVVEDAPKAKPKKVVDAEATIEDRKSRLEQKQTAFDDITTYLNDFFENSSTDPDAVWEGALKLVNKIEHQDHLPKEAKEKIEKIKQLCVELRAECEVLKGEKPTPAERNNPNPTKSKIIKYVLYICVAFVALQGILTTGYLLLKRSDEANKPKTPATRPNMPYVNDDGPITAVDVKALLAARNRTIEKIKKLQATITDTLGNPKEKKLPATIKTEEEARNYIIKLCTPALEELIKAPLRHSHFSAEQLSGDKPLMVFADKFKGEDLIVEVRMLKYQQQATKDTDLSSSTGERPNQHSDYHLIDVTRKYTYVFVFKGPITTPHRVSGTVKTKYIEKKQRKHLSHPGFNYAIQMPKIDFKSEVEKVPVNAKPEVLREKYIEVAAGMVKKLLSYQNPWDVEALNGTKDVLTYGHTHPTLGPINSKVFVRNYKVTNLGLDTQIENPTLGGKPVKIMKVEVTCEIEVILSGGVKAQETRKLKFRGVRYIPKKQ